MKKLFLAILIISVCVLSSCKSGGYKITGKFETDATGQVFLSKIGLSGVEIIDSTRLVNGTFKFTGSVAIPELYLIEFENNQEQLFLFIENANIKISGNTNELQDVVVKGSKLNDIYFAILKGLPYQDEMQKLEESFYYAQMTGDQIAINSILADRNAILEEIKIYFLDNIKSNCGNPVGAILILQVAQALTLEEFEESVNMLKKSLPNHPYTIEIADYFESQKQQQELMEKIMGLQAGLEVGKTAPSFILTDINGKEVDLRNFRGKYVLIDFWASWCKPCRDENPNLVKAYKQFGGSNFEIISVSVDKSIEDWKKAVSEDGLIWTNVHDSEGIAAEEYAVVTIPSTWLLDKEGKIVKINLRGDDLNNTLKQLIK